MRRPRRAKASVLPIVDRIHAARPTRKPSGRSRPLPGERFAHDRLAWRFGDPDSRHAPWCLSQPPLPAGECSCHRHPVYRRVAEILRGER